MTLGTMPFHKFRTATVTIASGESLSGAVEIGDRTVCGVILPAEWTAAGLTFQVSIDGSTYQNLYDSAGEFTLPTDAVAAARTVTIDPVKFLAWTHVKVRSGTSGSAVNQDAARSVVLIVRDFA